jgi:hypothetical protein
MSSGRIMLRQLSQGSIALDGGQAETSLIVLQIVASSHCRRLS